MLLQAKSEISRKPFGYKGAVFVIVLEIYKRHGYYGFRATQLTPKLGSSREGPINPAFWKGSVITSKLQYEVKAAECPPPTLSWYDIEKIMDTLDNKCSKDAHLVIHKLPRRKEHNLDGEDTTAAWKRVALCLKILWIQPVHIACMQLNNTHTAQPNI